MLTIGCSPSIAGENTADPGNDAPRPPLVRVAPVVLHQVQREIDTTAYLEAERRVSVTSKVPGRVVEVLFDEGARVGKGQVLARLDDAEARAVLQVMKVQLDDRVVRLRLAELEVEAAGRREEQARIEQRRTQAELDRLQAQRPDDVSRKAMEEARFAAETATEALSVAGFNARKAELDRAAAENAIAEAQARVDEATTQLAEHQVLAPLDGTLVDRHITGGETITSGTELFDVIDLDHLITYISRPQIELPLVQNAREVVFHADAHPGREFVADIDLISPVVEEATGHFRLRARVRAADVELLRPGMFIRARILTENQREALLVPKAAVLAEGDVSIVFAVRDGLAFKVVLDPGLEQQTTIECRNRGDGGLRAGDVVVVAGHSDLEDQVSVEISQG